MRSENRKLYQKLPGGRSSCRWVVSQRTGARPCVPTISNCLQAVRDHVKHVVGRACQACVGTGHLSSVALCRFRLFRIKAPRCARRGRGKRPCGKPPPLACGGAESRVPGEWPAPDTAAAPGRTATADVVRLLCSIAADPARQPVAALCLPRVAKKMPPAGSPTGEREHLRHRLDADYSAGFRTPRSSNSRTTDAFQTKPKSL